MNSDMKFIESIRKLGKSAPEDLCLADVEYLIKMVACGDLMHVNEMDAQHIIDQQERIKKLERELFAASRKARMDSTND